MCYVAGACLTRRHHRHRSVCRNAFQFHFGVYGVEDLAARACWHNIPRGIRLINSRKQPAEILNAYQRLFLRDSVLIGSILSSRLGPLFELYTSLLFDFYFPDLLCVRAGRSVRALRGRTSVDSLQPFPVLELEFLGEPLGPS